LFFILPGKFDVRNVSFNKISKNIFLSPFAMISFRLFAE